MDHQIESDINILIEKIKEIGTKQSDGSIDVTFGSLYEATVDVLEALNGTLRSAKRNKIIDYKGQMLLKGPNDKDIVKLFSNHIV